MGEGKGRGSKGSKGRSVRLDGAVMGKEGWWDVRSRRWARLIMVLEVG